MVSLDDLDARHVWHPFTQAQTAAPPILISKAKGATLTAADGTQYIDLVSSWWVNLHGHGEPRIARAIAAQAETLEHVIFAGFTHAPAIELARRLTALLPPDLTRVFFSDNGSTAIEVALKIAYQYWRNRGAPRARFIAFDGGYHGDTVGAMSLGKGSGFHIAFEDLMLPVDLVPFAATWDGDEQAEAREAAALEALDRLLAAHPDQYAAAIIEPLIQGASGMRMCRPQFVRKIAARLKAAGTLLVFDEVMTGFGRTGAMFSCTKAEVAPDIICLSKGITGGFLPLAVTVCKEQIHAAFLGPSLDTAFLHGHSYTANPLGCAAALASLEIFASDGTLARIGEIEQIYRTRLRRLANNGQVEHTRVCGAIAAFDVKAKDAGYDSSLGPQLKSLSLARGLLLRPLGNVIYVMPPYCISNDQLHRAFDAIEDMIGDLA